MKRLIEKHVQQRFDAFERDGFALLARIPSSNTKRYLAAFRSLDAGGRALFRQAAARRAAQWWGFPYEWHSADPDARLFDEIHRMAPYPDGIWELGGARAKAPELRKIAKLAFEQLLECQPEKSAEPGDWFYRGRLLDEPVSVQIRYSTRLGQVFYGLQIADFGLHHSFSVENFFGFGIGTWDLISIGEADSAFAILKEVVLEAVREYKAVQAISKPA